MLKLDAIDIAQKQLRTPVSYNFTPYEKKLLKPFFTNTDKNVFFMRNMPPVLGATLQAMYSRIQNPRGLRGVFVDSFLPTLLLGLCIPRGVNEDDIAYSKKLEARLKENKIASIEAFKAHEISGVEIQPKEACMQFEDALDIDSDFFQRLYTDGKITAFLTQTLDKWGHKSIARLHFGSCCIENISVLAAKAIEWVRVATGIMELSTRYVKMDNASLYPFWEWVEDVQYSEDMKTCAEHYMQLYAEHMQSDAFENALKNAYASEFGDASMNAAINGEVCDVLGNALPSCVKTSVGIAISGEAFNDLISHLLVLNTPETVAIAHELIDEGAKTGDALFARHIDHTEWERERWQYLSAKPFIDAFKPNKHVQIRTHIPSSMDKQLVSAFRMMPGFEQLESTSDIAEKLLGFHRDDFDKLWNQFEYPSFHIDGIMPFKGWRDIHRQTFCTHMRTYMNPHLPFFQYTKPAYQEINTVFKDIHKKAQDCYDRWRLAGIPESIIEYAMPMGTGVGFQIGANLRQWEFVCWQRSKRGVYDDVRTLVLDVYHALVERYPWWNKIARIDKTDQYAFARGNVAIDIERK